MLRSESSPEIPAGTPEEIRNETVIEPSAMPTDPLFGRIKVNGSGITLE
jgi:hypothetical protein